MRTFLILKSKIHKASILKWKFTYVLFFILTCSNVLGQSDSHFTADHLIEFYYKGKIGYMDIKGNVVVEPLYGGHCDTFRDGYVVIATVGDIPKYGLINHKGKLIIPFSHAKLKNLGHGMIVEQDKERKRERLFYEPRGFFFEVKEAQLDYDPVLDRILVYKMRDPRKWYRQILVYAKDSQFLFRTTGRKLVRLKSKDKKGAIHLLPYYRTHPSNHRRDYYSILDLNGKVLYDSASISNHFINGKALMQDRGHFMVIDTAFNPLDSCISHTIEPLTEPRLKWALSTNSGMSRALDNPMPEKLHIYEGKYYVDEANGTMTYTAIPISTPINKLKHSGLSIDFDTATKRTPAKENQKLDKALDLLSLKLVSQFKQGLALVKRKNKFGLIDSIGNLIIPCEYDSLAMVYDPHESEYEWYSEYDRVPRTNYPFIHNNCIVFTKNKKYGMMSLDGTVIHEAIYDDIQLNYYRKYYFMLKKRKFGICWLDGSIFIPLEYRYVSPSRLKGNFTVWEGDIIGLSSDRGKIYWPKLKEK